MTKIINLFGGPCSGKSTTATGVFSLLKSHDVNCEYVSEFSKDLVWEERQKTLKDQIYIFGEQQHKLFNLIDKVDVIITDSPLLLSLYYSTGTVSNIYFHPFVLDHFHSFDNTNYYLKRIKKYNESGRYQNEDKAKEIDFNILNILKMSNIKYEELPGNYIAVNFITNKILKDMGLSQIYSIYKSS